MPNTHHTLPAVTTPSHACDEEECAICFEAMSEGTAVAMPGCTHRFHGQCLVQNMLVSRCCPLCRNDPSRQDGRDDTEAGVGLSHEDQREAEIFHYEAASDRAVRRALDTADSETMDQARDINKHSIELHKLNKESMSLQHNMQTFQADCRKQMLQCRTQSREQYKTDHSELLARKNEAAKSYKYTTDQMHDAYYRIAYSGGYATHVRVLDYCTSLKIARMMHRGDAQRKIIHAWIERRKQSLKELRTVNAEDSNVRKQINSTVSQKLKLIGNKFKQLEDVKSLSKRIIAIRKKQCLLRRKIYAIRDGIAMRQGWVPHPDIVVDQVLQLRRRDARFSNTRFYVPRYEALLPLKKYFYPVRRMHTI